MALHYKAACLVLNLHNIVEKHLFLREVVGRVGEVPQKLVKFVPWRLHKFRPEKLDNGVREEKVSLLLTIFIENLEIVHPYILGVFAHEAAHGRDELFLASDAVGVDHHEERMLRLRLLG